MYVAVKGGEKAIENAHAQLADRRRGDREVPALSDEQVAGQLSLAVARVTRAKAALAGSSTIGAPVAKRRYLATSGALASCSSSHNGVSKSASVTATAARPCGSAAGTPAGISSFSIIPGSAMARIKAVNVRWARKPSSSLPAPAGGGVPASTLAISCYPLRRRAVAGVVINPRRAPW